MLRSEGEISDHAGAAYLVDALPRAVAAIIAIAAKDSGRYSAALEGEVFYPMAYNAEHPRFID